MPKKNDERHGNILGVCCIGDIHGSTPEHAGWDNCKDYNCPAGASGSVKKNREVQKALAKEIQQKKKNKKSDVDFYLNNNPGDHPTDDTILLAAVAHTLLSGKYLEALNETKGKNLTEEELETKYLGLRLDADFFVDFCKFHSRYTGAKGEYGPAFNELVYELSGKLVDQLGLLSLHDPKILLSYELLAEKKIKQNYMAKKEKTKKDKKTYVTKSWGNGAAMRVAPCGFVADSLAEARALAKVSAINTHENYLAIKGAQMVASFIFLARIGLDMQEIKAYMNYMYRTDQPFVNSKHEGEKFITSCDFDKLSTDEIIKKGYPYCIRCDLTVIPALVAVFESENFFDAIDRGYKLGGDCDTMGIMISAMAESYYGGTKKGAPKEFANAAREKLVNIKYSKEEKALIDGKDDNDKTGEDNVISKISNKLDKNFGDRYRANADKNWQVEKIEQTIEFLKTQAVPEEQNGGKKQELENLIKLMNDRKEELKDEIKKNEGDKDMNNNSNNNQDQKDDEVSFKNVLLAAASADYFGAPLEQDVWSHNANYCDDTNGNHSKYADSVVGNREVQKKIENYIEKNKKNKDWVDFYLPDEGSKYCKPSKGGVKEHFTDDTMLMMAVAHTFNSDKYKDILLNKTKGKKLTRAELEDLYKDLDADVFINFLKFSSRYREARRECGSSLGKVSEAVAKLLGIKTGSIYGNVNEVNLLNNKSEEEIKKAYKQVLNKYKDSKMYKDVTKSPTDGVVMRDISGYVANSLEEAKVLAKQVAINTHGDKLALEAAEVKAVTIFWGRNGWSEQDAANYVNYFYRKYDDSFCESNLSKEIRDAEFKAGNYDIKNITTEQVKKTAPYLIRADLALVQSLRAFRESKTFIDSVYTVAKLGGDMDTTGIITASMKASYVKVPNEIIYKTRKLLPKIEHTGFKIDGFGSVSGPDDVMLKVNDEFDKNFSNGYRKFADKSWQIENTSLLLVDLYKESEKQMSDEKRKDLNDLIESVEKRKLALIEDYINILTKQKENETEEDKVNELNKLIEALEANKTDASKPMEDRKVVKQQEYENKKDDILDGSIKCFMRCDFNNKSNWLGTWLETIKENKEDFKDLGLKMLKIIDDKFEDYESQKTENKKADDKKKYYRDCDGEIERLKSQIEYFAKTFGIEKIGIEDKKGNKKEISLSEILKSELDIGTLRVIWEQIKNVFTKFEFMGYNKTRFRIQRARLMSFGFGNNIDDDQKRPKSVEAVRKKINGMREEKDKDDGKDFI